MRYLPVAGLKEQMVLGQNIYDGEGRMLLAKNQILTQDHIHNLQTAGLQGIYIEDEASAEIEIEQLIQPEIRSRALQMVHALFGGTENAEDVEEGRLRQLVMDVVEDVVSQGEVMYNMMDLKTYDNYTFFHSVNVAVLSAFLGARYGMDREELQILAAGGLLHDIGKRFLEADILNAKRPLTESERHIMLQHAKLGYEFLRESYDFPEGVYLGVLEHTNAIMARAIRSASRGRKSVSTRESSSLRTSMTL